MARLPRVSQRIFGSTPLAGNQFGQIGSLNAGSPIYTTDLAVMQALSNYLQGMYNVVLGNNAIAIQDINSLFNLITAQLAYIFELGIPEWDAGTTYYIGGLCTQNGIIYRSLIDTNLNNSPATVGADWAAPFLPGVMSHNAIAVDQTVLTGDTLTHANPTVNASKTLTVNSGGYFLGFGALVVSGTVVVNGTLRML